jgi:hypothetical protein
MSGQLEFEILHSEVICKEFCNVQHLSSRRGGGSSLWKKTNIIIAPQKL